MYNQINILIADDHSLVAKLLKANLIDEKSFNVVGLAKDGAQVIELLKKNDVNVLLLDIDMPKVDGIKVLNEVKDLYPGLKIIMLTNHTEGFLIKKALELGANGFITKFAECDEVKEAIFKVMEGESYLCNTSFQSLVKKIKFPKANQDYYEDDDLNANEKQKKNVDKNTLILKLQLLSDREKEILDLIIKENTTKTISEKLYLSTRTVETHRKNIIQKLGVKNSLSLMKLADEIKIVEKLHSVE